MLYTYPCTSVWTDVTGCRILCLENTFCLSSVVNNMAADGLAKYGIRAPFQYLKRRLSIRSRQVSKPRDLYLELSDHFEIWQALRQQCCRCACQNSKRYDNLKYQSRGFETLRDLTKIRLFGYWDGALSTRGHHCPVHCPLYSRNT